MNVLLTATEALAKSCTKSAPAPTTQTTATTTTTQSAPSTTTQSALTTPSAPTPIQAHDSTRPTVHVAPAKGRAGNKIPFRFVVGDNSSRVRIVLTIYQAPNNPKVLLTQSYGTAAAEPAGHAYVATIRAHNRGTNLWCVTATDGAGNKATACSSLVVS